MHEQLGRWFRDLVPDVPYCALRFVEERSDLIQIRQGVLQPVQEGLDVGVMITVGEGGGLGYAATSELSPSGLRWAIDAARDWARRSGGLFAFAADPTALPHATGTYRSTVSRPWESLSLRAKIDLLQDAATRLKSDPRIVDWEASLWRIQRDTLLLTNHGGRIEQRQDILAPSLSATAHHQGDAQTRSMGARGESRQGGLEILDGLDFLGRAPKVAEEAVQLLLAANCPSGVQDVVLMPDQMMLQIHESIGHPLELDRILGDERNYAGTSFVSLDMFGSYRYGSDLLNVTFDPGRQGELASFAFDDDGLPAQREHIIRKGILERPLGGSLSQARAGVPGVANARATSWNRPTIDRMANLNLEAGDQSLAQLIGAVERGVLMRTNNSWSIDDSRNKFQFGCELGQRIENGELREVVKNPCYRGISATFWRSLAGVGDEGTQEVLGTPYCGKGEPNQVIRVGHASPACRFTDVDVFGGA